MISRTVSNTHTVSRVGVRGERLEHTHRPARRHVTHVCCAIVVFQAHRWRARARDPCCATFRRRWATASEEGMLRVTPSGKEITCTEQVCVTRQRSPPAKKITLSRTQQNSSTHLWHHHKRVSLALLLSCSLALLLSYSLTLLLTYSPTFLLTSDTHSAPHQSLWHARPTRTVQLFCSVGSRRLTASFCPVLPAVVLGRAL